MVEPQGRPRRDWASAVEREMCRARSRARWSGLTTLGAARTGCGRRTCTASSARAREWKSSSRIHGQSVQEEVPDYRRAILARVELTTQEELYQWLNTCFLVGEGEIDEEREVWWLTTYVCVNEVAQGPPAIGAKPPERFRQQGTTQAPVKGHS